MGCWLREFDGDFFSIFFLSGLHELFLIEKSLEIAAPRGWGLLHELFLIWAAYCWAVVGNSWAVGLHEKSLEIAGQLGCMSCF